MAGYDAVTSYSIQTVCRRRQHWHQTHVAFFSGIIILHINHTASPTKQLRRKVPPVLCPQNHLLHTVASNVKKNQREDSARRDFSYHYCMVRKFFLQVPFGVKVVKSFESGKEERQIYCRQPQSDSPPPPLHRSRKYSGLI